MHPVAAPTLPVGVLQQHPKKQSPVKPQKLVPMQADTKSSLSSTTTTTEILLRLDKSADVSELKLVQETLTRLTLAAHKQQPSNNLIWKY